jgi:16S rRNA (guanine966-N2)-methyltransferase
VRVVAGRLGGRALKAPPGDSTRPTSAKVKEALFSILGDVSALRVLDLYSGSGALGIEALSRGAVFATFVESARPALACLRDNLAKLGLEQTSKVLPLRVESAPAVLTAAGPFELVLCDAPWKDAKSALETLGLLAAQGCFTEGAPIVLEHSSKDAFAAPLSLEVTGSRRWGDTAITFYRPAARGSEPADAPGARVP